MADIREKLEKFARDAALEAMSEERFRREQEEHDALLHLPAIREGADATAVNVHGLRVETATSFTNLRRDAEGAIKDGFSLLASVRQDIQAFREQQARANRILFWLLAGLLVGTYAVAVEAGVLIYLHLPVGAP
jgi:hypothetical protein